MESESKFWDLKPFWCQPWSIIAFGILLITIFWIKFHNIIITSFIFSIVAIWWILFLLIVPLSYKRISEEK